MLGVIRGTWSNGLLWSVVFAQCLLFTPIYAEMYIGTAVNRTALEIPEYARLVRRLYQVLTPGNEMKWGSLLNDPNHQDVYNFQPADEIVKFAKAYKKKVHGHCILWQRQLSPWVEKLGKDELRKATNNHINSLRKNVWFNNIGEGYIAEFFKTAREAANKHNPDLKLFVNDYSIEGKNPKSDKLYAVAKDLKQQGLLDGVGFQSHLILGQVPKDMSDNLKRFADLGLQVAITELDVRFKVKDVPPEEIERSLEQQAQDYQAVFGICHNLPACVGVTVWGVTDALSWIYQEYPGFGKPLLHDEKYAAKSAFNSVQKYFGSET